MAGASIIALAGAGGDLGGRIAKALVARGATVHALVRPGLKSDEAQRIEATGATLVEADPANISAMATACAGASCVVSALNGVRKVMIDRQSVLLEGAVKAGVPRFIPSDYSADFTRTRPGDNRNFDLRREFMAVVDRAPVKATSVLNGAFMDMLGAEMPIIQPSIRRVLYWQDADQPLDFTTKDDTAGYVAAVAMDDNTPRILRIAGDVVSARDIARTMGEVTGERYRTLWAGSNAMLGAMTTVPSWSPDGREIAYLKRVGGRTQAWRVAADGGGGAVVTDAPVDVEDVAWSADGMRLVFATRPGRIAFAAAARGEAREGYLFDDRVLPPNGPAPQLPADLPRAIWAVPRLGGVALAAAALDVARLSGERPLSVPYPLDAVSAAGRRAGADRVGPQSLRGSPALGTKRSRPRVLRRCRLCRRDPCRVVAAGRSRRALPALRGLEQRINRAVPLDPGIRAKSRFVHRRRASWLHHGQGQPAVPARDIADAAPNHLRQPRGRGDPHGLRPKPGVRVASAPARRAIGSSRAEPRCAPWRSARIR